MYKIINRKKLAVTMAADIVGNILFYPQRFLKSHKSISHEKIKEILIIRTAYIGDVIMTLPILRPLKEFYPSARITFLTSSKARAVLANNPYIDEILIYDAFWFYLKKTGEALRNYIDFLRKLREQYYDLVIDARADIRDIAMLVYASRSKYKVSYRVGGGGYLLSHIVPFEGIKHKVEYHLDIARFLGCTVNEVEWDLYITSEEKNRGRAILLDKGVAESDIVVGIHPGGRKDLKCWPFHNYAQIADWIISRYGAAVVFTGSQEEHSLIDDIMAKMSSKAINLAGRTDLRLLASLLERFNLFICNDSAPLHIASATKTPTVAIFGPSKSKETGPYGNTHRVVEKDFPCRYTCDENMCNRKIYHECMKAITPDDVSKAVQELWHFD